MWVLFGHVMVNWRAHELSAARLSPGCRSFRCCITERVESRRSVALVYPTTPEQGMEWKRAESDEVIDDVTPMVHVMARIERITTLVVGYCGRGSRVMRNEIQRHWT
jgi:hypothetical protein